MLMLCFSMTMHCTIADCIFKIQSVPIAESLGVGNSSSQDEVSVAKSIEPQCQTV